MFPDDENGDVLRRMVSDGDDLSKPRDIDFVVVFSQEAAASLFADQIRQMGHQVTVDRTDTAEGFPWDARVVRYMVPEHGAISHFESQLAELAAHHGGRNDGWGCFSVPVVPDED
ncbi:ribonuclease E inhibitor RraB [Occallatibacter savannae]|uniref:ribonuclease E inhibitor RraB n=1 Tax=Occallatibacter savannae TaxID=1002691 RepID=UPI000D68E10A|nr:ribonuclease E inhibitor RraB [Occallatibacter savannae]